MSKVANCKFILGENLTTMQHRRLVMDLCVNPKDNRVERWWLLNEGRSRKFASAIGDKCVDTEAEFVQVYWNKIQAAVTQV
ncbi:unnamed protein product [Arctia plantaginis]|uniref:Uncharacterized protein n=1 Tax=Arctia plantaginis TaxID=874455 RepID=A0A8S0ZE77_ARCPL|nr:unnamed protein product [Arctia plantaginis]